MLVKAIDSKARAAALLLMMVLTFVQAVGPAHAAGDSFEQAIEVRAHALESLGASSGNGPLKQFIEKHAAKAFRASIPETELLDLLRRARKIAAGAGAIDVRVDSKGFALHFRGAIDATVKAELEAQAPHLIAAIRIDEGDVTPAEDAIPLSWDELEGQLEEAEAQGFSGTVLVVRGGELVLHRGFGMANRERGAPNSTETIFGIGSTPIDFTKASVLLLEQRGKLARSDAITQFIADVPKDKRGITIEHLMTGGSGFANFHHLPDIDDDHDLTYIDRDEAVERMMQKQLMFAPGESNAHSHSAWVLLAALVEIVSGESYADFLSENFFKPAGMTRTGFYGQNNAFKEPDFAVGYGSRSTGKLNIPMYWGATSWLVMGSGGMVSTVGDMYKWTQSIASGKVLNEKAQKAYWVKGVLAGGSDRGFLFTYSQGFESGFFLSSNAHAREGDLPSRLTRSLAELVMGE